jgi:hypothetical protein
MNQRRRFPLRSRRTMAPSLDQLESRQLLSASPVHVHAEPLHHLGCRNDGHRELERDELEPRLLAALSDRGGQS